MKSEKPSGLVKTPFNEASNYKNCFRNENLSTQFKSIMLKIYAKKADNTLFNEDEVLQLDKFVDTLSYETAR